MFSAYRDPEFVVCLDVETANSHAGSVCQFGLAVFKRGRLIGRRGMLVNPQQAFDQRNIDIHGITADDVAGEPLLSDVWPTMAELLSGRLIVSHTAFDRTATRKMEEDLGVGLTNARWLDSAKVARRTWHHCAQSGYGLGPLCLHVGHINEQAHDAMHDAIACGVVLHEACDQTGMTPFDWFETLESDPGFKFHDVPMVRSKNDAYYIAPAPPPVPAPASRHNDSDCITVCLSGQMYLGKPVMTDYLVERGFVVKSGVSRKIDILVYGAGTGSKLRQAKELQAEFGKPQIMTEQEFKAHFGFVY